MARPPSRSVCIQTAKGGSFLPGQERQDELLLRPAAEIFTAASRGASLHQIRHSAITHLAEEGVPITLLMAKSRHESLATLQRYAKPSVDAVAQMTAAHDPASRSGSRTR